ncbi:hypothetical protein GCM10010210_29280 [Pseudonocardia hydrocarbonoxydans]|uniref:FAD/NAD(P)-binding domain-containing protein n=2 Tax=Pseudonocardia hydrocarbonoxydans TaxID=76726 RepID=A0A4Y3WMT6_9PSEU|nr:hypothetical protein PHY01_09190 [Pseudonocardia hydrocarbonoxydans]
MYMVQMGRPESTIERQERPMRHSTRVVIVGAGGAGSATAVAVARAAPEVEVIVLGAEGRAPYNRTTVNKGLLSGAVDDAGVALPGMDGLGIDWRTATVARSLHAAGPAVELADGRWLGADVVVLATGAPPRGPCPPPSRRACPTGS